MREELLADGVIMVGRRRVGAHGQGGWGYDWATIVVGRGRASVAVVWFVRRAHAGAARGLACSS